MLYEVAVLDDIHTLFMSPLLLSQNMTVLNCVSSELVMHGIFLPPWDMFSGNGIKNGVIVV